jgi:uncharacterized membrane protein YfhO
MIIICGISNRLYKLTEYGTGFSEYLPIEVDKEYIKERKDIVTSNNDIKYDLKRYKNILEINFKNNDNNTYIELPLIYYKGYTAKIEKSNLKVYKTNNGLVGVIINDINRGTIKVKYEGTILSKVTKVISLISSILFLIYVIKKKRKKMCYN